MKQKETMEKFIERINKELEIEIREKTKDLEFTMTMGISDSYAKDILMVRLYNQISMVREMLEETEKETKKAHRRILTDSGGVDYYSSCITKENTIRELLEKMEV